MRVIEFEDAVEFHQTFTPLWLEHESMCGVIYRISKANKSGMRYYAVFDDDDSAVLTACLNPSDQIIIAGFDPIAAEHLVDHVVVQGLDVPGIFAPDNIAQAFAERYFELTGKNFKRVKALGHDALKALTHRPEKVGEVRLATPNDHQTLTAYRDASQAEGNTQRPVDSSETVTQDIEADNLYVLELADGHIVSTGSIHWDRFPASAYVDNIYTPIEQRGNGYATALTFALSELILAKDKVARLSVDVENAPAIAVYEKLGYVRECKMYNLRQAPST